MMMEEPTFVGPYDVNVRRLTPKQIASAQRILHSILDMPSRDKTAANRAREARTPGRRRPYRRPAPQVPVSEQG